MRRVLFFFTIAMMVSVLLVVVVVGALFLFPSMNFWGMTNVAVRNSFAQHVGDDVQSLLRHRNLIIVASHTNIEINIRKPGQYDEETINVFENATGITFNHISRTLIDWTQVLMDNGEVFYKVTIREPAGAVTRNATVTFNLIDEYTDFEHTARVQPWNFILRTGMSNVTFTADEVVRYMFIDNLVIENSGGFISFPAHSAPTAPFAFFLNINSMRVVGRTANVSALAPIMETVHVDTLAGRFVFGDIGTGWVTEDDDGIVLRPHEKQVLTIRGDVNTISAASVFGSVLSTTNRGTVNIGDIHGDFNFYTLDASTTVGTVLGDTVLTTDDATRIGGWFNFSTWGSTNLIVRQAHGTVDVNTHRGHVIIGQAGSNLGFANGARGDVNIVNPHGSTSVMFAPDLDESQSPTITVEAYDGGVTVANVVGLLLITFDRGGHGWADVHFRRVVGHNQILYSGSTRPNTNHGAITVRVVGNINAFQLRVEDTARARDRTGWDVGDLTGNTSPGLEIPNYNDPRNPGVTWAVRGGSATNTLTLRTSNWVDLSVRN